MEQQNSPTVTVIVPTYDRPHLLRRALTSIAKQTYRQLQVIVVDDCSPTMPDIGGIEGLEDADVLMLRHVRQQGPGAARNTGLAHASGRYVTFLDDDDEFAPERIRTAVESIDDVRMHACAVSDNIYCYDGDRRSDLLHGAPPRVTQVLFHREDVEQFDPTLRLGEDVEWWIRMADRAVFAWSGDVGVIIDTHDSDRPGASSAIHAQCRELILRRHWRRLDATARQRHLNRVAALHLAAGSRLRAICFACLSLVSRPTRTAFGVIGRAIIIRRT